MPRICFKFEELKAYAMVYLSSPLIFNSTAIRAFIDTGSDITILSPKDAETLRIKVKDLPLSNRRVGDLGGHMELRMVRPASFTFQTEEGGLKTFNAEFGVNCTKARNPADLRIIQGTPSLLGMHVLTDSGWSLSVDGSRKECFITAE